MSGAEFHSSIRLAWPDWLVRQAFEICLIPGEYAEALSSGRCCLVYIQIIPWCIYKSNKHHVYIEQNKKIFRDMVYIQEPLKKESMKVTRRSDKGKGGHLLISVPARRVAVVDLALHFLEAQRQQRGS